jgi:glycerol-3-phosphate dehydrogenase
MNRKSMLQQATARKEPWDIIVIGGGATGVGVAVDASARGYATLLLERDDFGKGTSSRSTKLVHGGVRYLEQGNISLVLEALRERGLLRQNAPHLVSDLPFIVPSYSWWEGPFYGIGLKLYQLMSGKYGFGPSEYLSSEETARRLPNIKTEGLMGGVVYFDGQFDDTRLLIQLAATAVEHRGTLINYGRVTALQKSEDGMVNGVEWEDTETGAKSIAHARVVINATGPFTDSVRKLAEPEAESMISPSQGAHLVLDRSFLPGDTAIMVPHTSDGRVMFAIPWHGHTLVGTTDTPMDHVPVEPVALDQEIDFMLSTGALYLAKAPTRADILSVFAGIRPLAKSGEGKNTSKLSRDHVIHIDRSGLLSIAGGKWTTYRNMAEDCVDQAATLGDLPEVACITKTLHVHGYHIDASMFGSLSFYGTDAVAIRALIAESPKLGEQLDGELPYLAAEVVWAAREEMARDIEDVLARRTRALFLNAKAAVRMAPRVADLMARELGYDAEWQTKQVAAFTELAHGFQVSARKIA